MFTSEITVEFSPLPEEMEGAYWASLEYFAEVILREIKKEGGAPSSVNKNPEQEKV
jgi:hypothetical protein